MIPESNLEAVEVLQEKRLEFERSISTTQQERNAKKGGFESSSNGCSDRQFLACS